MLKRKVDLFLKEWRENINRKPLIISGARQIGKTTSMLSDKISFDLRCRGMKFVGSTIIYSYLCAVGIIYAHEETCFLYKKR